MFQVSSTRKEKITKGSAYQQWGGEGRERSWEPSQYSTYQRSGKAKNKTMFTSGEVTGDFLFPNVNWYYVHLDRSIDQ